jgi:N6-L-threonylcarbamoyladenine synthase
MPTILAVETSCDETSVAVVTGDDRPEVIVNEVASQIPLHQETGGVVPEVAAREQAVAMLPVLEHALKAADAKLGVASKGAQPHFPIDAVVYTKEPGLMGSLLVGIETAETLAELWQVPARAVHHVQGHIYGAFAGLAPEDVQWPAVVLVVSGGHTQLWEMPGHLQFKLLGETRDDAAGEAFDKMARLLGLTYPGGPSIAAAAEQAGEMTVELPRPMLNEPSLDFSFSGLKTALLYKVRGRNLGQDEVAAWARESQQAIVDVLVGKTLRAAAQTGAKTIVLAGGVAANRLLRQTLEQAATQAGCRFLMPDFTLCTDNAGMVGVLGWYQERGIMKT